MPAETALSLPDLSDTGLLPTSIRQDAQAEITSRSVAAESDGLSRAVYCVLGIPIDVVEMVDVVRTIDAAALAADPFVISTPNLNFLVKSQKDFEFRESILLSDLCPADGVPIVWIGKFLGIPIKRRIAGSDILESLKTVCPSRGHLKIFLFGATDSVAAAAAKAINTVPASLTCVGWSCPGFGTLEELSANEFLERVNSSGADFLMAALGAKKGQLWLQRNHSRLRVPIRAHLGATINFQAGTVRRAPSIMQKLSLEWLWRIKEEPYLWRRYLHDGTVFIRLMLTRVVPLAIEARLMRRKAGREGHNLVIDQVQDQNSVTLNIAGFATTGQMQKAICSFRGALATGKRLVVDFSKTRAVDQRFLGLLLMVRKQVKARGGELQFTGISPTLLRSFRLNGIEHLLAGAVN